MLAGGIAGGVEALIMYPTEYVKTQLQLQAKGLAPGQPLAYSGVVDCAVKIARERGPLALYKGVSTLVVGSIPKAAVRFAAFSQLRRALSEADGSMSPARNLLAGLGAGVTEAVVAVTPTEAIKTKLIADQNLPHPRYRGLVHGTSTMLREGGIAAIYAGLLPTICKQAGNQAARFTAYEAMKGRYVAAYGAEAWSGWTATGCGMAAGGLSVFVTMPFDVVKTQMQGLDAARYNGSLDCVRRVYSEDGLLAFWRGTTPRLGRVMCSGGITFAAYEFTMKQILAVWPDPPKMKWVELV